MRGRWRRMTPSAYPRPDEELKGRLDYRAQRNEPVKEAPFFRRQLGNGQDHAATFEIGIDASGTVCRPSFSSGAAGELSTARSLC